MDATGLLQELGVDLAAHAGRDLACRSPVDGGEIARLRADGASAVQAKVGAAAEAWREWRRVPPPRRGELLRLFGRIGNSFAPVPRNARGCGVVRVGE